MTFCRRPLGRCCRLLACWTSSLRRRSVQSMCPGVQVSAQHGAWIPVDTDNPCRLLLVAVTYALVVVTNRTSPCQSYRASGVEGSCAMHLTIEFYTVVMLPTLHVLLLVFYHPSLSFQALKKLFCKFFPP